MSEGRVKVGVLISGGGSNMAALVEAAKDPAYPAEIVVVISNSSDGAGLHRAGALGVEPVGINHHPFKGDREAHERAIDAALRARGVELVALAGYMRILTPWFVNAWAGRMLNIHPSLLPHFPGVHTHARALEAGHEKHGATVHWVTAELDAGPIIAQAEVPVLPGDTEETLAARVLVEEHKLYPRALAQAARGLRS